MKNFLHLFVFCGFVLLIGCVSSPEKPVTASKKFVPVGQGGQLPEEVVREASARYEGSMDRAPATAAAPGSQESGLSAVLGPINLEKLEDSPKEVHDAGQRIRGVIARQITAHGWITLIDAPKERFIDDSPRPDLARRGIKYVIKGIASYSKNSGNTTVFLHVVDTGTGKVTMVGSGRAKTSDDAATQATKRILKKMEGYKR